MSNIFRKPQTILRVGGSYDDAGRWVDGEVQKFTILASVQPLTLVEYAAVMQALPEGRRTSKAVKIYTDVQLQVAQAETDTRPALNPDILLLDSAQYEIIATADYRTTTLKHYKYYATEKLEGTTL